jgi:membrane-associated phospholipid phosphatase
VSVGRPARRRSTRGAAVAVGVAGVGSVGFALLARCAARGIVSPPEERVFRVVNRLSPAFHAPAWLVMQAGSLTAVPIAAAVAFPRHRATAVALAVDGTAMWASSKLIKRAVKRGRPGAHLADVVVHGAAQRGGGFPSGHAAVATTLAVIGSRIMPSRAAPLAWCAAALVCCAREYVGAHLPLDVAGGAALGLSAGTLANLTLDALQT